MDFDKHVYLCSNGESFFSGLFGLAFLDLSFNKLKKINSNYFKDSKHLFHLILSHNQIEYIETECLPSRLYEIDLSYNQLKSIGSIFQNMSSLYKIYLNSNKITSLDMAVFENMPAVVVSNN